MQARYIEYAKRTLSREVSFEGLRVVIDCANGAAYKVAPEALWELGAEVVKIGVEPNGLNINQDVGSTAPEALAHKVREMRADVGIALDGDADRMIIVDERPSVDGDQVMAVIAESWRDDGRLAKPGIVATVMSNLGLERYLNGLGLALERTAVGDRYVIERMREKGYNVGGEQSGHMIFQTIPRPATGSSRRCRCWRWSEDRPAGQRGLPSFRPAAAGAAQCSVRRGKPFGPGRGQGDRRGDGAARGSRPAGHPTFGHRTRHPGDGRGGRQGAG